VHVMRAFEDDDVIHAEDTVDPVRDIKTITTELRIKDVEFMKSKIEQHNRIKTAEATKTPQAKKKWEENMASYEKIMKFMDEEGKDVRNGMSSWNKNDVECLNDLMLLTAKPVVFAVNMNMHDYKRKKNKFLKPIFDWVQENVNGSQIIPYCGAFEDELVDLDGE